MCDICGVNGVADVIITCVQCKVNCEHMYCMRIHPEEEAVDVWICDECESSSKLEPQAPSLLGEVSRINSVGVGKNGKLPPENRKLQNESRVGSRSVNWEKSVQKGRTKYLSVKEAIKLSSGDPTAYVKFAVRPETKQRKAGANIFQRTEIARQSAPTGFSSQQDLASGSSQQPKLQSVGRADICKKQLQRSTKLTEEPGSMGSLQPYQAPKNREVHKQLPREIPGAQTKARTWVIKQSCTPRLNALPVTISGRDGRIANGLRISDSGNMNNNVFPDLEKCSRTPASDASWTGSFSISQDDHRYEGLNPQIQAYPPSRVLRKIHEFSKKMPEVLCLQLVPAKSFWTGLFDEHIPDVRDIALYFFPRVGESELQEYYCLLESISLRDWALREQIDDVELLVFSSKLLAVEYQRCDGKFFLWGVIRCLKRGSTVCLGKSMLGSSVQPPSDAAIQARDWVECCEDANMAVDVIGSTSAGRIDIPVGKISRRGVSTSFSQESKAPRVFPSPTT